MTDKKSNNSRRKLLKSIAAGSGAVVAGKTLPEAWTKPVVDTVMLPAHAETTAPCETETVYFIDVTNEDDMWIYLVFDACTGQGKMTHVNGKSTVRREGSLTVKEGAVVKLPTVGMGKDCSSPTGDGAHTVTIQTISDTKIIYDFQHYKKEGSVPGTKHTGWIFVKVASPQLIPALQACKPI